MEQFTLRTGSVGLAIVGQAIIFGAAHGYQSVKSIALIIVWGALYGFLVAACRKTLAPGVLAVIFW